MSQNSGAPIEEAPVSLSILQRFSVGIRSRGTQWMVLGAALAAIGAYLFQLIGTRALGEVRFAPIGTLWTIQYLLVSVALLPIETLVARQSLLRREDARAAEVSPIKIWGWLAGLALVSGGICWLLSDQLFNGMQDLALVVGLLVVSYGAFLIVRGKLAGAERFKAYGLVTATESIGRALLAVAVAVLAAGARAFAWIMPLGALGAAGWWMRLKGHGPEPRAASTVGLELPRTARFLAVTTGANAITQLLLAGGPLLLVFLHASLREVSLFFVTVTAVRVPMVFAFGGVLSRLLPTFMRLGVGEDTRENPAVALKIAVGTVGVALPAGIVAALVGSQVVGFMFGKSFAPPWWLAAGAVFSVLLATGSIIIYQLLIARGAEAWGLAAWACALTVSALAVALSAGSPTSRAVVGFVAGESAALIALVAVAYASLPRRGQA